jgi:hypothetical protein
MIEYRVYFLSFYENMIVILYSAYYSENILNGAGEWSLRARRHMSDLKLYMES